MVSPIKAFSRVRQGVINRIRTFTIVYIVVLASNTKYEYHNLS